MVLTLRPLRLDCAISDRNTWICGLAQKPDVATVRNAFYHIQWNLARQREARGGLWWSDFETVNMALTSIWIYRYRQRDILRDALH